MTKPSTRKFCLLMTEGSPIGLTYLEAMIANNFSPSVVIVSRTKKLSAMAIQTVGERTNNRFVWQPLDALVADRDIPVYFTGNHNSDLTAELIRDYSVDVAILGGTGIIKKPLLSFPKIGLINVHPGILPEYRGCSAVEWALYNNDEVGATCHFVVEEIDRGDMICTLKAKIVRGDKYPDVRLKAYRLQSETLIAGLNILSQADYRKKIQPNRGGNYYDPIDPEKLEIAKGVLERRRYVHYVE